MTVRTILTLILIFKCFESIEKYAADLVQMFEDLESGKFIQQNFDSLLRQEEGKQLCAEALYLLGVQLLTVDERIPGPVRERLVVSYFRYSGATSGSGHVSHVDTVCELLRSTGFSAGSKRPSGYPETFFSRVPVPKTFVNKVSGRKTLQRGKNIMFSCSGACDLMTCITCCPITQRRGSGARPWPRRSAGVIF